ncbi:uncharacterized protein V1513DRAFT_477436 [Lipomyces chichibuensis]|uniref:uncharacterized protein n=1 Tax=Lipomyces chichibuensis TaxID=1546026 RepID=UPI003343B033
MNNGSSTADSTEKLAAGLPYPDSLSHLLAELDSLFSQYGIPASIPVYKQEDRTSVQIHPSSLLDLYNALFDPDTPLVRPVQVQESITSRVKSVKLLIGTISQNILKMDLSYIDPLAVVAGDADAIRELLQVVVALGMTVRQKQWRVAQMQELAHAMEDDAVESEVSVEPNSDYSDDEDSDQGHASDLSSGVSIAKWKARATVAINRIGTRRSSPSNATDSIRRTVSDTRFARMLREYSPFGRANSPSSLLSIRKSDRLTRSFPNKSSPALLHVSTRINRISKWLPTPRQQWLRRSFSHLRRRAYQTTVPVMIANPKYSRSASLYYGIRQRNSRRNLLGNAHTAMPIDYNDEWITDDDDLGGYSSTPQDKYGDIELSETSNAQIRIPGHYLESQQLSHIKLSGLSSSYAGLALAASNGTHPDDLGVNKFSEKLVHPRNSDHPNKRRADLLSKSYHRLGGLHQLELSPPSNTVITRNENFVSPKKHSKFLQLKIDSAISASVDDDDDDIDDENTSLSSTEVHFRGRRRRMRRLTESQSMHDKREQELRSKFMKLNVE